MAKFGHVVFLYLASILTLILSQTHTATSGERKDYIVYMGALPNNEEYLPTAHHLSVLQEVTGSSNVADSLIRSYKRSFNGFAAKLTHREAQKLSSMDKVVSVFPSKTLQLHTTRSWDFLGFNETIKMKPSVETSDIIIGVLDTGIWPESASFSDEGFGSVPKKWKGACKGGKNFTCNNKIIGARYYSQSSSARDDVGHGSHTASTAAGNNVRDVSFYGFAKGTARGGFQSARIAAYKVCSRTECSSADIMAGFDDAIADGVDLITISIGAHGSSPFDTDAIAIGAFHAMTKGIITANSAGNDGPLSQSVSSVAPWMLSVAASTTDRLFIDKLVLGNNKTLTGYSVNTFSLNGTKFPLAYGKDVLSRCPEDSARSCEAGCLDSDKVKGKIVLCDIPDGIDEVVKAGATGAILESDAVNVSFIFPFPALTLTSKDYDAVKSYLKSDKKAEAEILRSEITEDTTAPVVAAFSSRGPNNEAPDILKPDITAPGVNILAAFSPVVPPSDISTDERRVDYSVLSGTSMSCPHAAAVAAYVKSLHPDWSVAAIKSAIMTTARPMSAARNSEAEFAYGSGHINPLKASDPGLVYETSATDYLIMLCGAGYGEDQIKTISGENFKCPKEKISPRDLNYPSMGALVKGNESFSVKFHRKVTNVGFTNATYNAKVFSTDSKLNITVAPTSLSFKSLNETKSFEVTVIGRTLSYSEMMSGALEWSDGIHNVRSPIVVHTYGSIDF